MENKLDTKKAGKIDYNINEEFEFRKLLIVLGWNKTRK